MTQDVSRVGPKYDLPVPTSDKPQALAVIRPPAQTYSRILTAVTSTARDVDGFVAKAGSSARGGSLINWYSRRGPELVVPTVITGVAGFIGAIVSLVGIGVGDPGAAAWLAGTTATLGASITSLVVQGNADTFRNKSIVKQQARRLTTKETSSFLQRLRGLSPAERVALLPTLTAEVQRAKPALSAKAYGEASAILAATSEAEVSPVDKRAAIVTGFIVDTLAIKYGGGNFSALRQAIDEADPDERRVIASTLEGALFKNEQQRAPFGNSDAIYEIITKAAEGLGSKSAS